MKLKLLTILMAIAISGLAQDAARNMTIQLSAEVSDDPASITLNWLPNEHESPNTYYIFRKVKGTSGWGSSIATLTEGTLSYVDGAIEEGVSYEYYVQYRLGGTIYAWGIINCGINIPLDPNKGDILLIVDETVESELSTEIETLEEDLYTDGWMVTTIAVDPTDTPEEVKAIISTYHTDLPNLKALYLLGNVPVPYSGELYPDAHDNHIGAWPADVYYGDIDGDWTDEDVDNTSAASSRNHNIPGDGKFDQSKIPSSLELQVSRVDFNDLPVFSETEVELLQNYLDKAHEFKIADYVPTERALVDQGTFTGMPEGFAQNGFRNFIDFFGADNVDHIDYWTNLNGNDYLWSYGCGAGSYTSAGGLNAGSALTSANLADGFNESTFTMLFGSYFGDWDVSNNLMRSAIANGRTLSCSWAARPNWYYHNMAMGENIGYSALLSQDIDSDYPSLVLGGGGFVTGEGVHVAQLGDPSLRMYYLAPPSDVIVTNEGSRTLLSWTASEDGTIEGYNVYRRKIDELWVKVNGGIIDSLDIYDYGIDDPGEYEFLVKSVKLKTNSSGTFYNESLGAIGTINLVVSLDEENVIDLSVYPNPNNGNFRVEANQAIETLTLLSMDGQIIMSATPNAKSYQIEFETLSAGTYFVQIESAGQSLVKKVVIQ